MYNANQEVKVEVRKEIVMSMHVRLSSHVVADSVEPSLVHDYLLSHPHNASCANKQ